MIEWTAIIISIISVVISIWAIVEARKARSLNYRSIKADRLDKYGTELREIQNSISDDLNRLSDFAWSAYEDSEKYLNKYLGYDRGVLYRFCSGFCDRSIQAIGTNDPFIYWHYLRKIDALEKQPEILKNCGEASSSYEALTAIPESDWPEIFNTIFNFSENYRKLHSEICAKIYEKIEQLDALIDRNKHEEIKLEESDIGRKLNAEKRKYNELQQLGLRHAEPFTANSRWSPLIETLCMLSTLYIVGKYEEWGGGKQSNNRF